MSLWRRRRRPTVAWPNLCLHVRAPSRAPSKPEPTTEIRRRATCHRRPHLRSGVRATEPAAGPAIQDRRPPLLGQTGQGAPSGRSQGVPSSSSDLWPAFEAGGGLVAGRLAGSDSWTGSGLSGVWGMAERNVLERVRRPEGVNIRDRERSRRGVEKTGPPLTPSVVPLVGVPHV